MSFALNISVGKQSNSEMQETAVDDTKTANGNVEKDELEMQTLQKQTNGAVWSSTGLLPDSRARCVQLTYAVQGWTEWSKLHHEQLMIGVKVVCLLLYLVYFAFAMVCSFGDEGSLRLLVITVIVLYVILNKTVFKVLRDKYAISKVESFGALRRWLATHKKAITRVIYISEAAFMIGTTAQIAVRQPYNLVSGFGILAFVALCTLASKSRRHINWHIVYQGIFLQFLFATLVLRVKVGYYVLSWIGERVEEYLRHCQVGAEFVFGTSYREHFFVFSVTAIIAFFGATMSVLYYIGAAQVIIQKLSYILLWVIGASPAESIVASANVILAMTESAIAIAPLLPLITQAELHSVITSGFATVTGSLMGVYMQFGVSSSHLLSASLMSAPAAIVASKLFYPETETIRVTTDVIKALPKPEYSNTIHALASGATNGLEIVGGLIMNLIAFISTLKFVNATLGWFGDRICLSQPLTFELITSYVLWPLSFLMGADIADCRKVAEFIGVKTFLNEFIAYSRMSKLISNRLVLESFNGTVVPMGDDLFLQELNTTLVGGAMSTRSEMIATYALCGFTNIGSMGIMIGSIGAISPTRRGDAAKMVFTALLAGSVACFMTACIAGLLYDPIR